MGHGACPVVEDWSGCAASVRGDVTLCLAAGTVVSVSALGANLWRELECEKGGVPAIAIFVVIPCTWWYLPVRSDPI